MTHTPLSDHEAASALAAAIAKSIDYETHQPTTDLDFRAYCFIAGLQTIVTEQQKLLDYLLQRDSERTGDHR